MKNHIRNQITIRSAIGTDAKKLFQWRIDEELNQYDPKPLPADAEELARECEEYISFFKEQILTDGSRDYKYYIIADSVNRPIGYINLFSFDDEKKRAELGIMIGERRYQRKGIANYALQKVLEQIHEYQDLLCVVVETNVENMPAVRLFERAGFMKVEVEDWGNGVFFQRFEKDLV